MTREEIRAELVDIEYDQRSLERQEEELDERREKLFRECGHPHMGSQTEMTTDGHHPYPNECPDCGFQK